MSRKFEVVSVNVSEEKGTVKKPVDEIVLDDRGIVGDAHAGPWRRQVSLLSRESVDRFAAEAGREISHGDFAENITTRGVDLSRAAILDTLRIGEVELQITQIGKECHGEGCAIFEEVGRCIMPKEGVFCRVLSGGAVRAGDPGQYLPRPLRVRILTLSDRAASGDYEDRAGPLLRELLEEHVGRSPQSPRLEIEASILPDDPDRLRAELETARDADTDIVFTTGGTGLGPRDIAPETVAALCDKTIPGIMEHIRVKYGAQNPNALLSRSIAGIARRTLIYALPGSPRAIQEYMTEILPTLDHVIHTIHGLDTH